MNKTTIINLNVLHVILSYVSSSEVGVKRYRCLDERKCFSSIYICILFHFS